MFDTERARVVFTSPSVSAPPRQDTGEREGQLYPRSSVVFLPLKLSYDSSPSSRTACLTKPL